MNHTAIRSITNFFQGFTVPHVVIKASEGCAAAWWNHAISLQYAWQREKPTLFQRFL